jgi:glycosyltransferase involved in cell wall biosynthesis
MAEVKISVIISSYNPIEASINATINGLMKQTLPLDEWELIVIDNNSNNGVLNTVDIAWQTNSKLIVESKQGLTYSRIAGVNVAKGEIIVMVDDDNVLHGNYLHEIVKHFDANPKLGTAGGKIEGVFDHTPAEWTKQFWSMLAIRDFGDEPQISEPKLLANYPGFAPVGAGMAIRNKH